MRPQSKPQQQPWPQRCRVGVGLTPETAHRAHTPRGARAPTASLPQRRLLRLLLLWGLLTVTTRWVTAQQCLLCSKFARMWACLGGVTAEMPADLSPNRSPAAMLSYVGKH
jgi:hypothetical protein